MSFLFTCQVLFCARCCGRNASAVTVIKKLVRRTNTLLVHTNFSAAARWITTSRLRAPPATHTFIHCHSWILTYFGISCRPSNLPTNGVHPAHVVTIFCSRRQRKGVKRKQNKNNKIQCKINLIV